MPRDDIRINRAREQYEQPHRWGHSDLVDVQFGPYEHITITMSVHEDDAERRALVNAIEDLIQGYWVRTGALKVAPAEKPPHEVLNDILRSHGRSERVQPVDDGCDCCRCCCDCETAQIEAWCRAQEEAEPAATVEVDRNRVHIVLDGDVHGIESFGERLAAAIAEATRKRD